MTTLAEIDAELARLTAMRLAAEDACSISEDFIEDSIDRLLDLRLRVDAGHGPVAV